jgi:zinc transporter 1/2/3
MRKGISTENFGYVSAAVIFVTNLIGNIGPIFITAPHWTARLESLSGGVFLAAGLAHLLADAYESLEKVENLKYPVAPAVCTSVFVLFTLVELFSYSEHDAAVFADECHPEHEHDKIKQRRGSVDSVSLPLATPSPPAAPSPGKIIDFGRDMSGMNAATISLYLIMCVHSSIEGLALGVLSEWSEIIAVFCAIVAHKPVEGFALSLIILKTKPQLWVFVAMISFYVILCPVGEIIGIVLRENASPLALGLIEAFSSGAFVFVGCHEWCEMFEHKHSWPTSEKLWHFGLFAFGVLWMLLVAIIEMFSDD